MQQHRRRGGLVLTQASRLHQLKLEPNHGDPLAIHALLAIHAFLSAKLM